VAAQDASKFDLDVGVMAAGAVGRVGLVVRNVTEPTFATGRGDELSIDRQVRAGASVFLLEKWILAADVDFLRQRAAFGDVRELSVGTESQITKRLAARAGLRLNTAGDRGRTPAYSIGGTFAALGSFLVDGQVTAGSDEAFRGWGVAGRVVF
jgi:F plasmid transfer operon, TraF, protein